jgi:hypothetical protein
VRVRRHLTPDDRPGSDREDWALPPDLERFGLDELLQGYGASIPATDDEIMGACRAWDGHFVNLVLHAN